MKLIKRQEVQFDASNEEHRREFHRYLETKSWGNCPVVFVVKGVGYPLPRMQHMLLEYYTQSEFGGK